MSGIKDTFQSFFGRRLNEKGQEVPDPTPVGLPLGYQHPPSLEERIQRMIAVTLSRQAAHAGAESFEEANDFDVGDPDDLKFQDEDDKFTPNDPNLKEAFEREEPVVRDRVSKFQKERDKKKEAESRNKAKPKAAPDAEPEGHEA